MSAFREFGVVLGRVTAGYGGGIAGSSRGGESLRSSLADYGSGLTRHSQSRTGAADLKALRAKPPPCLFCVYFLIFGAF